jgi:histidinol dehydrogenase
MIERLATDRPDFESRFARLLAFEAAQDPRLEARVAAIVADVRARGDAAVLEYTRRFDRVSARSVAALEVPAAELAAARRRIPAELRCAGCALSTRASARSPGATASATARSSASA